MLLFVTSLECKTKALTEVHFVCAHGQRFYNPMKLQKEAFNTDTYYIITFFSYDHENTSFIFFLFNSPVHFIVGPRVMMNDKFY